MAYHTLHSTSDNNYVTLVTTCSIKNQEHLYDDVAENPYPLKVESADNPVYQNYEMKQLKLKSEIDPAYYNPRLL